MLKFRIALFFLVTFNGYLSIGQTNEQSKIDYCKEENAKLEADLQKHKGLLNLQTEEVQSLKLTIQENEITIVKLKQEIYDSNQVSVNMLNVALKLEKQGNYQAALEIYKVLIRSYPNSLEAAASRIQIIDLRDDIDDQ